jgi:hypothetical protein
MFEHITLEFIACQYHRIPSRNSRWFCHSRCHFCGFHWMSRFEFDLELLKLLLIYAKLKWHIAIWNLFRHKLSPEFGGFRIRAVEMTLEMLKDEKYTNSVECWFSVCVWKSFRMMNWLRKQRGRDGRSSGGFNRFLKCVWVRTEADIGFCCAESGGAFELWGTEKVFHGMMDDIEAIKGKNRLAAAVHGIMLYEGIWVNKSEEAERDDRRVVTFWMLRSFIWEGWYFTSWKSVNQSTDVIESGPHNLSCNECHVTFQDYLSCRSNLSNSM